MSIHILCKGVTAWHLLKAGFFYKRPKEKQQEGGGREGKGRVHKDFLDEYSQDTGKSKYRHGTDTGNKAPCGMPAFDDSGWAGIFYHGNGSAYDRCKKRMDCVKEGDF